MKNKSYVCKSYVSQFRFTAGRQRSAARKIAAIERRAEELLVDFYALIPVIYREQLASDHRASRLPICAAWGGAWAGVSAAHNGLVALREKLEERAAALPAPPSCPFVDSGAV